MPTLSIIKAISGDYSDIAQNSNKFSFEKCYHINRHFFPHGEPISPHLLRCGPFAVEDHSFMSRRLASAATSTRE
jgi:hypothetical protein